MNTPQGLVGELHSREGVAHELTQRTMTFTHPVCASDAVRILDTGENVIVMRPRQRGGGWVVYRGAGALRRTPFGSSKCITIATRIIPPGHIFLTKEKP